MKAKGAGRLTFAELCAASGVTRGGITHYFPTKRALLEALMARDAEQWQQRERSLRPADESDAKVASLLGELRACYEQSGEQRRFVAGMLSAVTHDPELLAPIRAAEAEKCAGRHWSDGEVHRELLRMAALGLFWSDFFQCGSHPPALRARLIACLEALARDCATRP